MLIKTYSINNSIMNLINKVIDVDSYPMDSRLMGYDYYVNQYPKVNFSESYGEYVLKVELPGFDKKNLDIKYEDGILSLHGKREDEMKDVEILQRERFSGKFVRHFSLPKHIQSNKIKTVYRNGILSITIPKSESAKLKEIKISE